MNISDDPTRMEQPEEPEGGSLRPGQTFGQYKVIGLLGRGGMGEVYRVRHEVLEREYALKLIHPEVLESRDALQRFQDEARVMAKLGHPHIVKVDDFGTTAGRHWLRMELIAAPLRSSSFPLRQDSGGQVEGSPSAGADGERESTDQASFFEASLGEYVQAHNGRLPESHVREILRQILEGLGYAHGKGLVHRDIKPANILLAREASDDEWRRADGEGNASVGVPQVKIADFGLVRVAGEDWLRSQVEKSVAQSMSISEQATRVLDSGSGQAGTSTRALLGTYAYMSPEQKRGEDVDARSDLYAVGLMAYQMLTGLESLGMERPSEIIEGLNPEWDSWVLKSTKSKREERFSSAEEMLAALNELPVGVPPLGGPSFISRDSKGKRPPKGGTTRQITPRKRRHLLTTLSILFILALLGIGAWKGYDWWVGYHDGQEQDEQQHTEEHGVHADSDQREEVKQSLSEEPMDGESTSGPPPEEVKPEPLHLDVEEIQAPLAGEDYVIDLGGGVLMEFVWIPDLNAWVGKYEVTNEEYRRFKPDHDSGSLERYNRIYSLSGARQPVGRVSFNDAVGFTEWLNGREPLLETKVQARLLTGDEWTSIARCGTRRDYPWGNSMPPTRGNYADLIASEQLGLSGIDGYRDGYAVTAPVEESGVNEWGLYGVGGNVWEWTSEQRGSSHIVRGASWSYSNPDFLRIDSRIMLEPSHRSGPLGFRLLLSEVAGEEVSAITTQLQEESEPTSKDLFKVNEQIHPSLEVAFANEETSLPVEVTVTLWGEVNQPGEYTFAPGERATLANLMAKSGGFKPLGDKRRIRIIRQETDGTKNALTVDFQELLNEPRENDFPLQPNDRIIVAERIF